MADKAKEKIEDALWESEGDTNKGRRPTAKEILKTRAADEAAEAANKEEREAGYDSYEKRSKERRKKLYDNPRSGQ